MKEQWLWWAHAVHTRTTCSAKADVSLEKVTGRLRELVAAPQSSEVVALALEALRPAFVDWFQTVHQFVVPIPRATLKQICAERGRDLVGLCHDEHTGLISNACLAPECPYYLDPCPNFGKHLQVWGPRLPVGFHKLVRTNCHLLPDDLFQKFTAGKYHGGHKLKLKDLKVTKEKVLKYIQLVQEAYAADFVDVGNAAK